MYLYTMQDGTSVVAYTIQQAEKKSSNMGNSGDVVDSVTVRFISQSNRNNMKKMELFKTVINDDSEYYGMAYSQQEMVECIEDGISVQKSIKNIQRIRKITEDFKFNQADDVRSKKFSGDNDYESETSDFQPEDSDGDAQDQTEKDMESFDQSDQQEDKAKKMLEKYQDMSPDEVKTDSQAQSQQQNIQEAREEMDDFVEEVKDRIKQDPEMFLDPNALLETISEMEEGYKHLYSYVEQNSPNIEKIGNLLNEKILEINQAIQENKKEIAHSNAHLITESVELTIDGEKVNIPEGLKHKKFREVLETVANFGGCWLIGPSGTGKSMLAEQVAEAMAYDIDTQYEYVKGTAGVTEGHLTGRMDAHGNFIDGSVSRALRAGGFLMLDEFDGFDPNCGLLFNSVFDEQGIIATPNNKAEPKVKRHKDFKFIVASNTFGDGADFDFAGRNQLDLATLDRLQSMKVYIDYDPKIEAAICPEKNLYDMLVELRKRLDQNNIARTVSSRVFTDGMKWVNLGKGTKYVLDKLTMSWDDDELMQIDYNNLAQNAKRLDAKRKREVDAIKKEQAKSKAKPKDIPAVVEQESIDAEPVPPQDQQVQAEMNATYQEAKEVLEESQGDNIFFD